MQPPEEEVKQGAPEWVVTFGDMMSLLLTFFVMLLSFSTMEASKFKIVAGYMREAFGVQFEENYTGVPMGTTILSTDVRKTAQASSELDLIQRIRQDMEAAGMGKGSVRATERGVAVRLDGEVLFESGQADLRPGATEMLDKIAALAARRGGQFEVEGHSDNLPISNARYPSNWELSSARAGSAARYLISQGMPATRIRAVGYADAKPIVPNDSAANRAKNRRVEFLFVREPEENSAVPAESLSQPAATDSQD